MFLMLRFEISRKSVLMFTYDIVYGSCYENIKRRFSTVFFSDYAELFFLSFFLLIIEGFQRDFIFQSIAYSTVFSIVLFLCLLSSYIHKNVSSLDNLMHRNKFLKCETFVKMFTKI